MSKTQEENAFELRVIVGQARKANQTLRVGDVVTVGQSKSCDLMLPDDGVAKKHATVTYRSEGLWLKVDPQETVKVNGKSVDAVLLKKGDQLSVGDAIVRVVEHKLFGESAEGESDADKVLISAEDEALMTVSGRHTDALKEGRPRDDKALRKERREAMHLADRAGLWWDHNELPPLELQHVWFDINRDATWRSLAVVPAEAGAPVVAVAHAFAQMACMHPSARVLIVDATPRGERQEGEMLVEDLASAVVRLPSAGFDYLDASALGLKDGEIAHSYVPQLLSYISARGEHNRVIIAVGSLIENAQSIPVARSVDAAVIAVGVGSTRLPDVKRTVEIIGRDHVLGAIAIDVED